MSLYQDVCVGDSMCYDSVLGSVCLCYTEVCVTVSVSVSTCLSTHSECIYFSPSLC